MNKEVLIATQQVEWGPDLVQLNMPRDPLTQVIERVPISQVPEQLSSQHTGTLFVQHNMQDISVAIPITTDSFGNPRDTEGKGAIVWQMTGVKAQVSVL